MDPGTIGVLIVNAVLASAVSYGVGVVASALIGTQRQPRQDLNDALVTRSVVSGPLPGFFGTRRVAPRLIFNDKDDNKTYIIAVIAGAPMPGKIDVYINNKLVNLDANGRVTTPPWVKSNDYSLNIKIFNGNQTAADEKMDLAFSEWTAQHIGKRITYARIEIDPEPRERWQELFATGVPDITFLCPGFPCYDPAKAGHVLSNPSTWSPSNNPAIQAANYVIHELGMAQPTSMVDWKATRTAAAICDVPRKRRDGISEPRFQCTAYWETGEAHEDVLQKIGDAMAGGCAPPGDAYRPYAGAFTTPTFTLTEEHYTPEGIAFSDNNPMSVMANRVVGTFTSAIDDYETRDFPEFSSATALAEDQGEVQTMDLPLPFVPSPYQCQYLAKIALMRARYGTPLKVNGRFSMVDVIDGDAITAIDDENGLNGEVFKVKSYKWFDGEKIEFECTRDEPSFYAYDAATEERYYIGKTTESLTYSPGIAAPGIKTSVVNIGPASENKKGFSVQIETSSSRGVTGYEVDFKAAASTVWTHLGTIPHPVTSRIVGGITQATQITERALTTGEVDPAVTYNFRACAVRNGERSDFAQVSATIQAPVTSVPAPAAPRLTMLSSPYTGIFSLGAPVKNTNPFSSAWNINAGQRGKQFEVRSARVTTAGVTEIAILKAPIAAGPAIGQAVLAASTNNATDAIYVGYRQEPVVGFQFTGIDEISGYYWTRIKIGGAYIYSPYVRF